MLNPKQRAAIELMAAGCYQQKDIAEQLGVTANTITNWKKNDEFMAEYTATLRNNLKDVAALAFKTEVALLKSRNDGVRLAAARDILDRAGFKPEDKVTVSGAMPVIIIDDVDDDDG